MDTIIFISIGAILWFQLGIWLNTRKAAKAVSSAPSQPQIGDGPSSPDHTLVSTWIETNNYPAVTAWKWKCSCGGSGSANNAEEGVSLGSEENAIQRFLTHAKMYKQANGNAWKDKHDELQAKFDQFVEKCYCKDAVHHQPLERL